MNKEQLVNLFFEIQNGNISCRAGADIVLERMNPKTNLELIMDNKMKAPKGNFASRIN